VTIGILYHLKKFLKKLINYAKGKIYLFLITMARPVLWFSQPPVQLVPGFLREIKQLGPEADYLPPYLYSVIYVDGMVFTPFLPSFSSYL
jgi:hypothetical protein